MNTWEDANVIKVVNAIGRERIVLAGLWTSVCIVGPAISALEQGFEVYVITDACGDVSTEAHERAVERMVQAGAQPMTSLQYLLELQRDWARTETYDMTTGIAPAYVEGSNLTSPVMLGDTSTVALVSCANSVFWVTTMGNQTTVRVPRKNDRLLRCCSQNRASYPATRSRN